MRSHASGNLPTSTYTVPNIREKLQLQTCKGHFRVSSLITLLKWDSSIWEFLLVVDSLNINCHLLFYDNGFWQATKVQKKRSYYIVFIKWDCLYLKKRMSVFYFFNIIFWNYVCCVCMQAHMSARECRYLWGSEDDLSSCSYRWLRTFWCGHGEPNWGPLQGQPMYLTTRFSSKRVFLKQACIS